MMFLKELGHRIKMKTSDSQSFMYFCQRISISIQRFNAVAVLSHLCVLFCSL